MELAIVKHIKEFGLEKTLEKFKLIHKNYPSKVLIKYDQILASPTLMALPELQESRGIILEKGTWKVMSLTFKKFFNSEEGNAHKLDRESTIIMEKLDGSLIQLHYDWTCDTWFAGTTGTAEGEGEVNNLEQKTFNNLFWAVIKEKYGIDSTAFDKNYCYGFELTTPYNIVVTPHGVSKATLLMARNIETLEEVSFEGLAVMADKIGVPLVKTYDFKGWDVGTLKRTFDSMTWVDEGYVLVDKYFRRVKVKNPSYVAVHHTKNQMAAYHIMEVVKSNELEEYLAVFPDRFDELTEIKAKYDKFGVELAEAWEVIKLGKPKNISPQEKKRFATLVFAESKKFGYEAFTGLFFSLNAGRYEDVGGWLREWKNKELYEYLTK